MHISFNAKNKHGYLAAEDTEITEVKRKAQSCCYKRHQGFLCLLCDLCGKWGFGSGRPDQEFVLSICFLLRVPEFKQYLTAH